MSSQADKDSFNRLRGPGNTAELIAKIPDLPDDVLKRFPSCRKWLEDMERWRVKANIALRGGPQNS